MLDCEPLHDMKGHIQNIFEEIPPKLDRIIRAEVKALINTDLGKDM